MDDPKQPQNASERSALQHEAEHAKPGHKNSVLIYLVILFAAAFLLLLLSYFMQQRTNQERLNDLQKASNSAVQTLDDMLEENQALKDQNNALKDEKADLEAQLKAAQQELKDAQTTASHTAAALDWLWRIQRQVSRGYYSAARELVAAYEDAELPQYLPGEDLTGQGGVSPAKQYRDLLALLDITETCAPEA